MILSLSSENFCRWQELMMSHSERMEKGPGPNPVELQCYSPHHLKHTSFELHGLPPVSKAICDLGCGKIHFHQPEFNPKLERQSDEKGTIYVNKQNTDSGVSLIQVWEGHRSCCRQHLYEINLVLVILRDISSYVPLWQAIDHIPQGAFQPLKRHRRKVKWS